MRLVLANSAFGPVGGSETYLLTLGQNLLRLGHDVRIYASTAGDAAELARADGMDVFTDRAELGEAPDAIVAQDGAVSYELAELWPQVPLLFVCHSSLFDFQQPPLVPGYAFAVVVLNDRVRRRVEALDADLRVVRLRQPIDTQRFTSWSPPADRPKKALILSNYLAAELRETLVEAWDSAGVEVSQVGGDAGMSVAPEEAIRMADIVVARGRSALEAMSCGRPTYVYDTFGGDGWITPESYPAIEADGITGQVSGPGTSLDRLRADLEAYDPAWGRLGRELVLTHHDARTHAAEVVDLLREAAPAGRTGPTIEDELARMTRLRWAADAELFSLRGAVQRTVEGLQAQISDLTLSLQAAQWEVENLSQALAKAEEREADRRERGKQYRRQIKRLKEQLAEAEARADRPWWRRVR